MVQKMLEWMEGPMTTLDHLRSFILRKMLSSHLLRTLFTNKAYRLLFLYCLATLSTLTLSVFFPLWVLALGPALYGGVHLLSGLRYSFRDLSPQLRLRQHQYPYLKFLTLACLIFLVVALSRLGGMMGIMKMEFYHLSEWQGANRIELVSMLTLIILAAVIFRLSWIRLGRGLLLLFLPLLGFSLKWPLETVGAMVLIHNFVGFFYWIKFAQQSRDRLFAVISLFIFIFFTALIYTGFFDSLMVTQSPFAELFPGLSVEEIGLLIAPHSTDPDFWNHSVIAYALGQSLHYFVWLKAIPDQVHTSEVPTSFRQSFSLLQREICHNHFILFAIIGFTLASFTIWMVFKFTEARMIYFAFAAFHGYFELAGLVVSQSWLQIDGKVVAPSYTWP